MGSKDALWRGVRLSAQNSSNAIILTSTFPRLYSYADYSALYAWQLQSQQQGHTRHGAYMRFVRLRAA